MSSEQPTTTESTTRSTISPTTGSTTGSTINPTTDPTIGSTTDSTTDPTTEPTVTVTSRSDELGEDEWYVRQRNTLMTAQQVREFSTETNSEVFNTINTILAEVGIVSTAGQTSMDYYRLTGRETCELYMGELTRLGYTVTMRKTLLRNNYLNISWTEEEPKEQEEE